MTTEIEVENIASIKRVTIECPEDGGIVVLRGDNGKGKSTTLAAIESAVTGKGTLSVRDGALKGSVSAFGVTITVGKNTRRKGELSVTSLDSKLSIGELIDPGLKTPEAADTRRIKALLALVGAEADPSLFHGLFGGKQQFEAVASAAAIGCDDLVAMAERIKRDTEAKARIEEDNAEKAEGRAAGAKAAAGEIDGEVETDALKLSRALETAIRQESSLQAKLDAAIDAEVVAEKTRQQLADAETKHGPNVLESARDRELSTKQQVDSDQASVRHYEIELRKAEDALAAARANFAASRNEHAAAIDARKAAEQHAATLDSWRKQLAAATPERPTQEEIDSAADAVVIARKAVESGAVARRAKEHLTEHAKALEQATAHRRRAAALREAARGTDEVLSELVGRLGTPLRVQAGRLVTDTARGETYFHELSDGERAKMALDIGIDAAGPNAVIVFPQQQFEGLSPRNRKALADHARARSALVITAMATDDKSLTPEWL